MAKTNQSGVNSDQAALIHELLGQAFETALRQQLVSGEFNAAMLGKVLEWLKHNNISVVEEADEHLRGLASLLRKNSDGSDGAGDYFNFLNEVESREV